MAISLLFDREKTEAVLFFYAELFLLLDDFLQLTNLNGKMENVQAVLDSQFWLLIHVLLVVGSYGIFLLASLLAHVELIRRPSNIPPKSILSLLYMGLLLDWGNFTWGSLGCPKLGEILGLGS